MSLGGADDVISAPGREWVGIAANANSGLGSGRKKVEHLSRALFEQGLESRVAWTLPERSSLVERARHDPSCRCLIAVGGDGTVADLVNEQPGVPLTVLPAGTENLFARHFGLSDRPRTLARTVHERHIAPLDLGRAAGRRFTLMAGFGFDAEVVSRHHAARLKATGSARPTHRAAYVAPVLQASFSYRFPLLKLDIVNADESTETLSGTTAFLFNLPRYALGLPFAPTATGDDGLLDLVVFREPGPFRALWYLGHVFLKSHLKQPGVFHRSVRGVRISSSEVVPVQLDGDPGGELTPGEPWRIDVLPRAVEILVPAAYASPAARPAATNLV